MTSIAFYEAFVLASIIMSLTPGIDTAIATKIVLAGGEHAGIASAVGVGLGVVWQSFLAGVGLVAIFTAFPLVFLGIKYVGGAYLIYLGFRSLYDSVRNIKAEDYLPKISIREAFIQGFLGDALNPKITVFIVTFYPQFIYTEALIDLDPYLILGATYGFIATIWYVIYAFIAHHLLGALGRSFGIIMTRVCGIVLLTLGLLSIFS